MAKTKLKRIINLLPFSLVVLFLSYEYIYSPLYNRHEILKSSYGVKANPLRVKYNIPIIEKDMSPRDDYNNSGNRWLVSNEYPGNDQILHIYKFVNTDKNSQKITEESDAYRRKINDTVFQEVIIAFKFKNDKPYVSNGLLTYIYRPPHYLDHDAKGKYFDAHGIDSVAKKWHLDYLIKEK